MLLERANIPGASDKARPAGDADATAPLFRFEGDLLPGTPPRRASQQIQSRKPGGWELWKLDRTSQCTVFPSFRWQVVQCFRLLWFLLTAKLVFPVPPSTTRAMSQSSAS